MMITKSLSHTSTCRASLEQCIRIHARGQHSVSNKLSVASGFAESSQVFEAAGELKCSGVCNKN